MLVDQHYSRDAFPLAAVRLINIFAPGDVYKKIEGYVKARRPPMTNAGTETAF